MNMPREVMPFFDWVFRTPTAMAAMGNAKNFKEALNNLATDVNIEVNGWYPNEEIVRICDLIYKRHTEKYALMI